MRRADQSRGERFSLSSSSSLVTTNHHHHRKPQTPFAVHIHRALLFSVHTYLSYLKSMISFCSKWSLLLLWFLEADGFVSTKTTTTRFLSTEILDLFQQPHRISTLLFETPKDKAGENIPPSKKKYELENDFQMFLNQCALQSFLFLLEQLRDRETALYLEGFTKPILNKKDKSDSDRQETVLEEMELAEDKARHVEEVKLLRYHGLAIFDKERFPTWQFFFEKLLEEDAQTYIIQNENQYVPDYELEINPASLCSRIISVREQIAKEFVRDLDVIADLGGQTMSAYWESLKQQSTEGDGGDDSKEQTGGDFNAKTANLLFMESFDLEEYIPSPLRKGNFDLLVNLATQESIHRVLNNYHDGIRDDKATAEVDISDVASLVYLDSFYGERRGTHFSGSQWYGRADDFLKELLMTPPSTVKVQDDQVHLVDPIRIVELILEEREKVAMEWGDISYEIPTFHTDIKRLQLNKLMGGPSTISEENVFE